MNLIINLDFLSLYLARHAHLPAHVSHVAYSLLNLHPCFFCQYRVVDAGSIPNPVKETVHPLGRVFSGCPVNIHGKLYQTEPLGIGCLAQISTHLGRLDLLVVRLYLHIVQKIMPLRNEFTDRTSVQEKQQTQ